MSENQKSEAYTTLELILAICILFIPMLFIQIISVLLFIMVLIVLFSFLIVAFMGLCGLVAGITMVGVGIEKLFSMPMGALTVMGFGVTNIGIALMVECLVLGLYAVLIPALIKKVINRGKKNEETS